MPDTKTKIDPVIAWFALVGVGLICGTILGVVYMLTGGEVNL